MAACAAVTVPLELIGTGVYRRPRRLARALLPVLAFLVWDAVAIARGDWSFSPEYVTGKPDFTFGSLRGNAVLRWEYLPGSTLFFVWTQDRQTGNSNGEFDFGNAFSDVMNTQGDNIFAVKATYYWRP